MVKLIERYTLLLSVVIGMCCGVALAMGATIHTTVIVAPISNRNHTHHWLELIDLHRNMSIQIELPIQGVISRNHLREDGRKLIFSLDGQYAPYKFAVWDIFEGDIMYSPVQYESCRIHVMGWRSQDYILFQCRRTETTPDTVYAFHTETGNVHQIFEQIYSSNTTLMTSRKSNLMIIHAGGNIWHVTFGEMTTPIDLQGRIVDTVNIFPDGQSLLIPNPPLLERYYLADQSFELLFDNFTPRYVMHTRLSPNGEWVAWVQLPNKLHTFHIHTQKHHIIEYETELSTFISWILDGQYILIKNDEDRYYLAKPDESNFTFLTDNIYQNTLAWSPNRRFISYNLYNPQVDLFVMDLEQVLNDEAEPILVMQYVSEHQWLPDNDGLIFIHAPSSDTGQRRLGYYSPITGVRFLTKEAEVVSSEFTVLGK